MQYREAKAVSCLNYGTARLEPPTVSITMWQSPPYYGLSKALNVALKQPVSINNIVVPAYTHESASRISHASIKGQIAFLPHFARIRR